MSHFTYIGGSLGAWATGTPVGSGKWWQFDQAQFKSINGDEGGTWAPTAVIAIGGSYGLSISAPLLVSGLATFTGSVALGNSTLGDMLTVTATQSYNGPETHNGSSDWYNSAQFHNNLYASGTFAAQANASLGSSSTDTLAVNAASTFNAQATFNYAAQFYNVASFNQSVTFGNHSQFNAGIDVRGASNLGQNKTHAIAILGTETRDVEFLTFGTTTLNRNGDCAARLIITNTVPGINQLNFGTAYATEGSSKRIAYNVGTYTVEVRDQASTILLKTLAPGVGDSCEITFSAGRWWLS